MGASRSTLLTLFTPISIFSLEGKEGLVAARGIAKGPIVAAGNGVSPIWH